MASFRSPACEGRASKLIESLSQHFRLEETSLHHLTTQGDAIRSAIVSTLTVPTDLHLSEIEQCSLSAIRNLFAISTFSSDEFLIQIQREIDTYRKKSRKKYMAWSLFNFIPDKDVDFKFENVRIRISAKLPYSLRSSAFHDYDISESHHQSVEKKSGYISAFGDFRDSLSAGYALTDVIERLIAMFNLFQNSPTYGIAIPESIRSVFKVSDRFYLYNCEEKKPYDRYWTNSGRDLSTWTSSQNKSLRFDQSLKKVKLVQRSRRSNPLTDLVQRCMYLVNESWQADDVSQSLIYVWSAFEKLFNGGREGTAISHETIIRRASKFDSNPKIRETLLFTLFEHRNHVAHSNHRSGHVDIAFRIASEAKMLLIWTIRWALREGSKFRSVDEFISWLDVPKELDRLEVMRRLHGLAVSQWHPKKQKKPTSTAQS